MKDRVRINIEAIEKKAREGKMPAKMPRAPYSSLHKFIKTKEQADRFMKSLRDANLAFFVPLFLIVFCRTWPLVISREGVAQLLNGCYFCLNEKPTFYLSVHLILIDCRRPADCAVSME